MNENELMSSLPVPKAVAKMAIPSVISSLVTVVYNMADTFFVGQTGDPLQVAAVSLTNPIFILFMAFANMFGMGGSAAASIAMGENNKTRMKQVSSFITYASLGVGILFAIGFKIVGFPLAVILGLFIGFLNLIPYMQTIGIIPMILLSLLKAAETGENFWLIFGSGILVLCIVQCIQDLYLTPRIMGKAMGLNPAIILLSLSIWGTLLGFIGLIIALPLTTLFLSYYKRFILMEEDQSLVEKHELSKVQKKKTFPKE